MGVVRSDFFLLSQKHRMLKFFLYSVNLCKILLILNCLWFFVYKFKNYEEKMMKQTKKKKKERLNKVYMEKEKE